MATSGTSTPVTARRPGGPLEFNGALPLQLTSFIGREREIAAVEELLGSSRLLTLTGAGGAGKTRLALEVAGRAAGTREEAWIDLAPIKEATLVPQTLAGALGVREEAGRSALEIVIERFRERSILLILDNCEQVVDACATLVESLLRHCPQIQILATSREALGVSGEQAWLVPPLTLPGGVSGTGGRAAAPSGIAELKQSEAGRLFLERARSVLPSFNLDERSAEAITQICRRLDGIPLAIELAAARVRVLAPEQIAARLDDTFRLLGASGRSAVPRHRTLREAIDWSHALLSEQEAVLFRRLSVFAGSFSLDAVEVISPGPPVAAADVLDLVSALVDKSLVVMETAASAARYRLLEALRQYAREKLSANPGEEAEIRRRHAEFFVEVAREAERPTFGGASDRSWTDHLMAEEGNLRAAADWAEEDPSRSDAALQLGSALHWHWFSRGHFREARGRVIAALRQGKNATPLSRAKALTAASTISFWLGDHHAILAPANEAVALLRDLNDPWSLCYALTTQGLGLSMTDPAAAEAPLAEAVALARADQSVLRVFALYWQAWVAFARGERDRAHVMFHECLVTAREIGSPAGIAHSLTMLGIVEVHCSSNQAGPHLLEALRRHKSVGDLLGMLWTLEGIAQLSVKQEQLERTARILSGIRNARERIGAPWSDRERPQFDAITNQLRETLGSSAFTVAWNAGSGWSLDQVVHHALEIEEGRAPASPAPAVSQPSPGEPSAPLESSPQETRTKHVTTTGEIRIPGSLEVHALGPLKIVLNRRSLERDAWNSTKPRELLLFLLAHPEGCTREQVGVAFWPEASTEQVRNNFHVTLHRLRKTLGDAHWVPLIDERYRIDPEALVALDALEFERNLPAALQRLKSGDPAPLQAVLAQYHGDFLEHESVGDWHLELRDRLRRLYADALSTLGDWLTRKKEWRAAAEVYRSVISRDELHEPAYRALMICLAESGDRSEAVRLYGRLTQLLRKELEAEPEEETTQLFKKLKTS